MAENEEQPKRVKFDLNRKIPKQILCKIIGKQPADIFLKTYRSSKNISQFMAENWSTFNCPINCEFCIAPKDTRSDMLPGIEYDMVFYVFSTTFYEIFDGFMFSKIEEIVAPLAFLHFGTIKLGNELRGKNFEPEQIEKILETFQQNQMTCDHLILLSSSFLQKALKILKPKKLTVHHLERLEMAPVAERFLTKLDEFRFVSLTGSNFKTDFTESHYTIFEKIIPHCKTVQVTLEEFFLPSWLDVILKMAAGKCQTTALYIDYWHHPPEILTQAKGNISNSFPDVRIFEAVYFPPTFLAFIPIEITETSRKHLVVILEEWQRWAIIKCFFASSIAEINAEARKNKIKPYKARQSRESPIEKWLSNDDLGEVYKMFQC